MWGRSPKRTSPSRRTWCSPHKQLSRGRTSMRNVRAKILLSATLGAIALAGCSNSPSASPPSTTAPTSTTTAPPTSSSTTTIASASCTNAAISAAAMSATSVGPVSSVSGYGCSGSWAYANVVVGTTNSFDAVIVLRASGSDWTVVDRGNACSNHLVPSAIYTPACTTS
jgi:hypothetical protein